MSPPHALRLRLRRRRHRPPSRAAISILLAVLACAREKHSPEIVVTTIATFGDTTGGGAIVGTPFVARDERGRYFAASPFSPAPELVAVFDSSGRFIARIGALGEGPGEYRQPNLVVPAGDSVWIFDLGTRRINVLDAELVWRRSQPAPGIVMSASLLPGNLLLVNWPFPVGDSNRRYFQRYDAGGQFARAYEEPDPPCAPELCVWTGTFVFRADDAGNVWAARLLGELSLSRYDSSGRLLRRLDLEAPWFPPHEPGGAFPREMMTGVATDDDGHLWLAAMTPDPNAPDTVRGSPGDGARLDGVLEVRDTLDGRRIATRRFDDGALLLPLGRNLVASVGTDADGWARVEIWRVELK